MNNLVENSQENPQQKWDRFTNEVATNFCSKEYQELKLCFTSHNLKPVMEVHKLCDKLGYNLGLCAKNHLN